ncbi:MAG: helix-turn-helix transcriptional regulator [Clostridium butyricum]|nr:helix-turn-helix transcriptional regulator [Clostridium butyricum]
MNIGENIKKCRNEKEISQEKLAVKLDVSSRTLQSYESGRTTPTIETLIRISKILDVPLYRLIEGDGNLSKEEIEEVKKDPYYSLPPSTADEVDKIITNEVNTILPVIELINNDEYDLKELLKNGAYQDISGLIKDIVKNRLIHYNNLKNKK